MSAFVHATGGPCAVTTLCGIPRGKTAPPVSIDSRYANLSCPTCIAILRGEKVQPALEPAPAANHDKGRSPANFPHDCEACVYLGSMDGKDLYFCPGSSVPTVIARYGESPEDYDSGLAFVTVEPHLAVALVLALKQGLIQFGDVRRRL